jgi:hypothetical protein
MYTRFVRVADGPDAAHRHLVGQDQLKTTGVLERGIRVIRGGMRSWRGCGMWM